MTWPHSSYLLYLDVYYFKEKDAYGWGKCLWLEYFQLYWILYYHLTLNQAFADLFRKWTLVHNSFHNRDCSFLHYIQYPQTRDSINSKMNNCTYYVFILVWSMGHYMAINIKYSVSSSVLWLHRCGHLIKIHSVVCSWFGSFSDTYIKMYFSKNYFKQTAKNREVYFS